MFNKIVDCTTLKKVLKNENAIYYINALFMA